MDRSRDKRTGGAGGWADRCWEKELRERPVMLDDDEAKAKEAPPPARGEIDGRKASTGPLDLLEVVVISFR